MSNMTELGCVHNSTYETTGIIKGLRGKRNILRCSICHEILDYYPQYNEDIKEKK